MGYGMAGQASYGKVSSAGEWNGRRVKPCWGVLRLVVIRYCEAVMAMCGLFRSGWFCNGMAGMVSFAKGGMVRQ